MDRKDEELRKALDDIFGDTINSDVKEEKKLNESVQEKESNDETQITLEEKDIENIDFEYLDTENINTKINEEGIVEVTRSEEPFGETVVIKNEEIKEEVEENNTIVNNDEIESSENEQEISEEQKQTEEEKSSLSVKKIIIYFIIGLLIGFVVIFLILKFGNNKEYVSNCAFSVEDENYKLTEEYKINYNNKTITYISGSYNYVAKTEEFKNQIDYIKKETLPIIINSNGMSGFTYMYETTSDSFKVNSYLDFEKINMEKIAKIDQKNAPISFFEIKEDISYDNLKESLENKGFKCTKSK